jgi:hypothetical protein
MSCHESITDEFIGELDDGFNREAERVRRAPTWPETQKRIVTGTHAYLVALGRVEEGWSREQIENELSIRTTFGKLPNEIRVIGNRRVDDQS